MKSHESETTSLRSAPGPVTTAGKYNSSLNSIRHALFAKCLAIPGEHEAGFRQLFNDFHDSLRPRTPVERALVEEMVTSWWRKQRIWTLEGAHIAREIDERERTHKAEPSDSPAICASRAIASITDRERILDLFLRYETRYERQFHRALPRLLVLKGLPPDATPDIFETLKRTQEVTENNQTPPWVPPVTQDFLGGPEA